MKTARITQNNKVVLINIDEPQIQSTSDVKIKTSYASICGYDVMMVKGKASLQKEGTVGHEASGVVVELGSEASGFLQVGDRVTINPVLACHHCGSCQNSQGMYCENANMDASSMMSEYFVVHYMQVFKLYDHISLKEGCLAEPVTMALHTVRKAGLKSGDKVLILGGGAMGQIILRLAKTYPISFVAVVDPHEEKLVLAKEGKANHTINTNKENVLIKALDISGGKGFDVVIEASGNQQSAEIAFSLLGRGGTLIFFGLYGMDYSLPINLFNLYWKDASIHGVFMPNNLFFQALDIMPRLNLESVITALYPFSRTTEAFSEKVKGKHAKVMLYFGSDV